VKRTYLVPLAAAAAAGAVAAPIALGAGDPDAHAAKASVSVAAKEFKFTLRPTSAPGGPVTFRVNNVGKTQHDFKIAGKKTPLINPKKSATLTVSLKRGTYTYICTVPGHAASGMRGKFAVR
jgi:uncharacterized cupredoxin-like copper-binding protein